MIRMIQSKSERHAKSYFADSLTKSDYYMNDQELQGRFYGRIAERLGVTGSASREAFFALCENKHPMTGDRLTPRTKSERTVGYDCTFNAPKSLSVLHAMSKDNRILDAFEKAVHDTMLEIEAAAKTRVRKKGLYEDRVTSELVWTQFTHQTARPLENELPDVHVHTHAYILNCTWDDEEQKFKAAKFFDIKREMPYYQASFHKRLADNMIALGYGIRRTQHAFEIDQVPQVVIEHFSKRTKEIERIAKEKNITDAKDKDRLGARTRGKKQKGLSMADLKKHWQKEILKLTENLVDHTIEPSRQLIMKERDILTAANCVNHAVMHHFERASVVSETQLLKTAYHHSLGAPHLSIKDIKDAFEKDKRIIRIQEGKRNLCTTQEVLWEEKRMVDLAREGIDKMNPLCIIPPLLSGKFDDQQKRAIAHVMMTSNRVSIIRGIAGAGKTTLMKEAIACIKDAGKQVIVVAPSAQGARTDLKNDGYKDAETVARLLVDKKMQEKLAGQVIWVDEAPLLGTKDMLRLLQLATEKKARLILSGDTKQHSSVVRGDAVRILNTVAGIKSAEVNQIYRQRHHIYKNAVKDLSDGKVASAFEKLDAIGSIKTCDAKEPYGELVKNYVDVLRQRKSALVICPTHKEGEVVTQAIRDELRKKKRLGKKEIEVVKYENMNFTEAQKRDIGNYAPGQFIQFNQNRRGIIRGSLWQVAYMSNDTVYMRSTRDKNLFTAHPRYEHGCYEIFKQAKIALSKGDKIRITKNGFDESDKKKGLDNGMVLEVTGISSKGKIHLRNKISKTNYKINQDWGHLAHGHCITSQGSQGKTVDEVFIAQPSTTFGATDAKQFYVSVSRGRDAAHIYTDDKEELLLHASELGERQSALELIFAQEKHLNEVLRLQRADPEPEIEAYRKDKVSFVERIMTKDDYEP